MFEDFEFEEKKFNPWDVKSLEEFRYYCCPECPSKNVNKTDFISHALAAHPKSQSTIEVLEDNMNSIKTEEYVENLPFEVEEKFNPWDVKIIEEFHYYCCPECPSKYVTKSDFIKHTVILHSHSQSFIEVFEDDKAVIKKESSEVESTSEENTKPDTGVEEKVAEPLKENETFANIVKRFFPTAPDFQLLNVQPPQYHRYECNECKKLFNGLSEFNEHIKCIHEKIQYKCNKCEESFTWKINLDLHIQSVHENVRFRCEKCDQSFFGKRALKLHVQFVHESGRHNCNKCDKSFSWKKDLNKHIRIVHLNRQIKSTHENVNVKKNMNDIILGSLLSNKAKLIFQKSTLLQAKNDVVNVSIATNPKMNPFVLLKRCDA